VPGADCGTFPEAPGIGRGRDALVAAIQARPSVVLTPPAPVTIGGYPGLSLDLAMAPTWRGGCVAPGGTTVLGTPILVAPGPNGLVGVGPDAPVRLILVDIGDGRTMAVAVFGIKPTDSSSFQDQAAAAMPIIDSFELTRPSS